MALTIQKCPLVISIFGRVDDNPDDAANCVYESKQ